MESHLKGEVPHLLSASLLNAWAQKHAAHFKSIFCYVMYVGVLLFVPSSSFDMLLLQGVCAN